MTYDGMCLTEGDSLFCKMLCNISSVQETFAQLFLDLIHTELGLVQHFCKDINGGFPGINGIKKGFLYLPGNPYCMQEQFPS